MREEIIQFLQSVTDEEVMTFIFCNSTKDELCILYHYLGFTTPETQMRWESFYSKLLYSL